MVKACNIFWEPEKDKIYEILVYRRTKIFMSKLQEKIKNKTIEEKL